MAGTYADITDVACDVVIIGAGVIGCAAAYNLAKKGRSVTVLDREPNVGEGASSRNGGGVRQSGRDARELPLAMYAVENIWPTLSDELGADVEYVKRGNLRLGKTEEHLQTLRKLASMSQGLGLDMKMIGPDEVREINPYLSDQVIGASWCPTDGHANPMRTTLAYYRAAKALGVRFVTGVEVKRLRKVRGRVAGVECNIGTFTANDVLLAAGLGLEHFLDLRQDAIDAAAHRETGTPRTIEGPLYVANAPLAEGHARMDDGADAGEVMWLHGEVKDTEGRPVANAIVDIWHANTLGNYSFFDPGQSEYNLRRRIRTGADGRYSVRSIMPSGYGCPPDGPTQKLLDRLGRHGNRPAHIHFFVSAPGHKHLTSQINLNGDKYLWDDFAFATRDGLIADPVKVTDREIIAQRNLEGEHTEVCFDFTLCKALSADEEQRGIRVRAKE